LSCEGVDFGGMYLWREANIYRTEYI
jgi:hypothetical protein